MILLAGHCPHGCGQVLYVDDAQIDTEGNRVVCMGENCPDPQAVHRILADAQTDHRVHFSGTGFTIRHPLRERIDDALMDCELHLALMGMPGPPEGRPGTFRFFEKDGRWEMERLDDKEEADTA